MKSVIPTTEAVHRRLLDFMTSRGWTPNEFATAAGVSEGALRHIERQDWMPSFRLVKKLEAVIPEEFDASKEPDMPKAVPRQSCDSVASARPATMHAQNR